MLSNSFRLALIWLLGGTIAFMVAYLPLHAVIIDGHYVPYGPDSFYHVRRILSLLYHGELLQFDPVVDAPYGGYISWPWGFDSLVALVIYIVKSVSKLSEASVFINIAPIWAYLNAGLIVIMAFVYRLPWIFILVAVISFSLSPLTQGIHQVGRVDHHMVEQSFILGSLVTGLIYFRHIDSRTAALYFGALLGFSLAFHNGLFILQVPVLVTFIILWFLGIKVFRTIEYFSLGLIAATLLILLPAETFRLNYFSYYLQSWFHLYVACCTSAVLIFLARTQCNKRTMLFLALLALLLVIPIITNLLSGLEFVSGKSHLLAGIGELSMPVKWGSGKSIIPEVDIASYSGLLLLMPVSIVFLLRWTLEKKTPFAVFTLVFFLFGTVMMMFQYRFNYYGSYALYLAPLICTTDYINRFPKYRNHAYLAIILIFVLCYYPSYGELFSRRPVGGSYDYQFTYQIYDSLEKYCDKAPGVVLADHNDGHYITYHTKCSVIANNMVMTPLDFNRVKETKRLLSLTSREIIRNEKWIDYIFVRRADNIFNNMTMAERLAANKGLRRELLFSDKTPDGLKLIHSITYDDNNKTTQYLAKVFKIVR